MRVIRLSHNDLNEMIRHAICSVLNESEGARLTLYHGSPHDFIKFQTSNIGTGEGNQSFGYGLYFTENKGVAEYYAKTLSGDKGGYVYEVSYQPKNGFISWLGGLDDEFKSKFSQFIKREGYEEMPIKRLLVNGKIETKSAPIDEALDYFPNMSFFYRNLSLMAGGDKAASKLLFKCGYDGIVYPSNSLRINDLNNHGDNYVLFSGDGVKLVNKTRFNN